MEIERKHNKFGFRDFFMFFPYDRICPDCQKRTLIKEFDTWIDIVKCDICALKKPVHGKEYRVGRSSQQH